MIKCIKSLISAIVNKIRVFNHDRVLKSTNPKKIFTTVYKNQMWGPANFNSGYASTNKLILKSWANSVIKFLKKINPQPKILVDFGCGNFNVGNLIYKNFSTYIACDVVVDCIKRNKKKYSKLNNVEFKSLDVSKDKLPKGDMAIIRLVLQHMTNFQILKFLIKLRSYKYIIVTEYIFDKKFKFMPNLDQRAGALSRRWRNPRSFVDITCAPFNFKFKSKKIINQSKDPEGAIQTIAYTLI